MSYLNVTEVNSAMTGLANSYPDLCDMISLPNVTVEGRTVHALRVGKSSLDHGHAVLFIGAAHAREWGGSEICVYFATDLLEAYTSSTGLTYGGKTFTAEQVRYLVDNLHVFLVPCVNPDGRNYSQTVNSMWRKNRNGDGVDLNRNYDFLWDFPNKFSPYAGVMTSTNSSNDTYYGAAPFSEAETRNIRWLFDAFPQIKYFIDIHSYSELILVNWGDDENQTTDTTMNFRNPAYDDERGVGGDNAYKEYIPSADMTKAFDLANKMKAAISAVRGKDYTVQQSFALYPTSGTSDDYAYGRHFVNSLKTKVMSYCIEFGRSFHPSWGEMELIVDDIVSGLIEFCLGTSCYYNDPVINLNTPSVNFIDVPEGEVRNGAVVFEVRYCRELTFMIVDGPHVTSGPPATQFNVFSGSSATLESSTDYTLPRYARLWLTYTGTDAGDTATGEVTVRCAETGDEWVIQLTANTVNRPTVAVVMCLDKSNSMNFESGIPQKKRIDVLKFSAPPFIDIIQENNAVGLVSFDHDAYDVHPVTGPLGPPQVLDADRAALRTAIFNHTPNPQGWTSIGDGVDLAHQRLAPETGYDLKAILVLTDGHENRPKYLSEVTVIDERVYAIGLGTADQIQPAALTTLTNGSGGYMLMTGELDDDAYFRLAKYYLQILAGVTNHNIVLDPEGYVLPGQVHRIPFNLNEADLSADVILLSPAPGAFKFYLETPSGSQIDPGKALTIPGGCYVSRENVSYYRLPLPIPIEKEEASVGTWHAVLTVEKSYYDRYLKTLAEYPELYKIASAHGLRYSLSVHAYSNVRMNAYLNQDSFEPGANMFLNVRLSEHGLPVTRPANVTAEITRPDGSKRTVKLSEKEPGLHRYETGEVMPGVHRFKVHASGATHRGSFFTREQTLTGSLYRGGDDPVKPCTGKCTDLCDVLTCILSEKVMSEKLVKRAYEAGIDLKNLRDCLKRVCDEDTGSARLSQQRKRVSKPIEEPLE